MANKNLFIADFSEGQPISEIFALARAERKEAKNGPYWQLSLTDRSGSIEARIWFPQSQQYDGLRAEQFVAVNGQVTSFKDQLQMNITDLAVIDPHEAGVDLADFLPSSSVPPAELLAEMEKLLDRELTFKPWKTLCHNLLKDDEIRTALLSAPGAKAIHHAYAGGLLEHTLGIMRICRALADLYPQVDREILLVGALCHDLGKAFELTHGISREYTDAGRLIGHIQMGLERLEPFLRKVKNLPEELALHLKHLILSHHGEYEFGSPRRPKTVEAFILHYADNLDAKVNTVGGALPDIDDADQDTSRWSDYHRTLGRYLYQPVRTPRTEGATVPRTAPLAGAEVHTSRKAAPGPQNSPLMRAMGLSSTSNS